MESRIYGCFQLARTPLWCRMYSLSLRNLPKVAPKEKTTGDSKKPNRFAEMYLKKPNHNQQRNSKIHQGRKHSPIDEGTSLKVPKAPDGIVSPQVLKESQYEQYTKIRQRLNERSRQQSLQKQQNKPHNQQAQKQPPKKSGQASKKNVKQTENIKISIPTFVTVSNLATIMNVPLSPLLKKLEDLGFEGMSHNYILDKENAALIADEYGFDVTMSDETGMDLFPAPEDPLKMKARPPVVTIMGHVDHGKTTILDYLRKSSIVQGEFGGITQHIGAFSVLTPISKKKITFLDTPGHAAFLSMRERGAIVTDIVILVVAADDSVMPQTIEAIKHAKKAGVPMIIAINKCDKPGIKIDKVLSDLARHEIDIEDYGGETQTVQVSGKTGMNMDKLEEAVITLSELSEFKAEPTGVPAEGWIIESQVVKGLGNVSTVLVRRGTVKVGSFLVAGTTYCKVRGMKDEHGKPLKLAGPSTPVQVWGWKELPQGGDQILEAKTEQVCRKVIQNRESRKKQIQAAKDIETINEKRQEEVKELKKQEKINELKMAGLDVSDFFDESSEQSKCTTVNYIVKSDVFGSAEAIKESIDGLGNDEVKAKVISFEAGTPTESDLDTAEALGAEILCFNVKVPKTIQAKADRIGVNLQEHNIIYRLIEGVTEKLTSKLAPHIEIKVLAEIEIKNVFKITGKNKSTFKIAGCKVASGNLKRANKVRVMRKGEEVFNGHLSSLKHVKQDVSEAKKGTECGLSFENWDKFEEGDKVEAFEEIEVPRFL